MALYRENATGFLCEYASNPGAGYTAISAMPTGTIANRVTWWRGIDTYGQTSSWHPSEYRSPQDPAEAALSIQFTREAAFISADASGTVTDAYLGANTEVRVYRGTSDVTITEGWTLTKVEDGCASTLTQSGGVYTLAITNIPLLATKQGYVRITATRVGVTVVRDFNFIKVFAGQTGPTGPQGPSGAAGPQGPAGDSLYTWIAYANDATGSTGFTTGSWSGQTYIGIANNKTSSTESTNPADYTWSKIQGDQGVPGTPGADGTATYTWFAYANDATGSTGFTTGNWTNQTYMGIAANKTTATESTNPADYTWSKIQGATGPAGPQGPSGDTGPQGTRGSRQILVTTATGAWDNLTAWNGIVSQTGTNPVPSDLVTIAKTDGSVANSKFYTSGASPGVWTAPTAYINGSLLVTGTVGANQLAAGSVTTNKLTVGSGGNWLAGSGPTSGSEIAYWNSGYNDTGLTATKAAGVAGEYPTAGASVKVSVSGTPASGKMISLDHANMYPVMAGQKYEISAYLSGGSLSVARVILAFFNASGTYISETASADVVVPVASSTLANWARAAAIITAPANATQAYVIARGVCNGGANPKLCLTQAYFGKAGPNQTEFSDWSPSGVLTQIDGSGIKTATITADRMVAGTITAASGVIGSLDASKITTGTLSANYISGGTINGTNVTVTNLSATNITGGTLSVDRIAANSISGGKITVGGVDTTNIASGAISWIDSRGRVHSSPLSQKTTSGVEIEIAQSTAPANSNRGSILVTCLLDVASPSYGAAPTQACNLFIYRGGTLLDYQGIYVVSQYYHQMALSFVDTSAPTSATTYYFKWKWKTGASGCLVAGSITLMELKR